VHTQYFANRHTLLPFIWYYTLHQNERATEEQRLRKSLSSWGVSDDHLRGLAKLEEETWGKIMTDLSKTVDRSPLLYALKVLGRCKWRNAYVSREDLDCIVRVLPSADTIPFDTQVRLTSLWQEDFADAEHFEDIIHWASMFPRDIPKQGKWAAVLRKRITKATWSSPLSHKPMIGKVRVQTISRGSDLLTEGERMGHCLRAPGQAYERYLRCVKQTAQVFHLDIEKNPLICATLSVEMAPEGPWSITDFETVGRGKPPQLLRDTANVILGSINDQFGYQTEPDSDDDEEFDFH